MRWSFRIAKIADTVVEIHVTFLLLLGWLGGMYYLQGGWPAALDGIAFILLLFACVLAHEFGHVLAARRYGIDTPTITLLPIGGVARLRRIPDEPIQELVVAIAGPLVNVAIALGLYIGIGSSVGFGIVEQLEEPSLSMATRLFSVNVILVLFNLVPAFPMDGGRILRALLAMRLEYVRATRIAASIGQGLAFVFGFIGLFANPLLIFVALFVYLGASQEASATQFRELARGLQVEEAMSREVRLLSEETSLGTVADAVIQSPHSAFVIVDDHDQLAGVLTRAQIIEGLKTQSEDVPIRTLMWTDVPTVRSGTDLLDVIQHMQEGAELVPVLDDRDRVVGLISSETIGHALAVAANRRLQRSSSDGSPFDPTSTNEPIPSPDSTLSNRESKSDVETQ